VKKNETQTHAGFVAIIGAPNAGKSTLLNRVVGQKISIASPKAQTTRMRIVGVMTDGDTQIGLIDTPGIFAPKRRLDKAMVLAAWQAIGDADAVVWLVDARAKDNDSLDVIIDELKKKKKRVILALNKTDALPPAKLLPLAERMNDTGVVEQIFMISALTGDGVDDLKNHIIKKMPSSPWFFDEEQLSDLPARLLAAEITREQLFRQLQQELPYAATVVPETWESKKDGSAVIHQTILVARENHRPIVIGKGGARIKSIGQAARKDIEAFTGQKVHLFLEVKTDEKWQEKPEFYKLFGLEFGR
jgi:GTP-binding protein Era